MPRYVVLLRGINVGGKNTVSMATLKDALEELGYTNVSTYINSGNILLDSKKSATTVKTEIEAVLPKRFKLDSDLIKVLVLTHDELKAIVAKKPNGFGEQPAKYHSDVLFLIGVTATEVMPVFKPREGVDRIWPGNGVIYSQRLSAQRTKSRLNVIAASPLYKSLTIRSWTTTEKLLTLLEAKAENIHH